MQVNLLAITLIERSSTTARERLQPSIKGFGNTMKKRFLFLKNPPIYHIAQGIFMKKFYSTQLSALRIDVNINDRKSPISPIWQYLNLFNAWLGVSPFEFRDEQCFAETTQLRLSVSEYSSYTLSEVWPI